MAAADTNQHDVVVVGAGVIGLACAWRAAERGLRVLVLERDRPGAGASNVAAGMLAPVGEATFGEDRLLELAGSRTARVTNSAIDIGTAPRTGAARGGNWPSPPLPGTTVRLETA